MLGLGLNLWTRPMARGGASPSEPLPHADRLVAHWDASAIPPQTDNTALTSWTDSINGFVASQATSANRPVYRATAMNGRPCVQSSGSQWLSATAAGSALLTTMNTRTFSVLIVYQNIAVRTNGCLFGCTAGGNSLFYLANGARQGRYNNSPTGFSVPIENTGFTTLGGTSTIDQSGGAGSGLERIFVNGGCVASNTAPCPAPSASTDFGIFAGRGTGTFPSQGQIADILVWDVALTPAEMLQAERFVREKYGQPLPWEGQPSFLVCHGDSQTAGVGGGNSENGYPYQVAATLGLKYGQWTQLGIGGINITDMTTRALFEVDPISAVTGIPTALSIFEWFNQRNNANSIVNTVAYLNARRAAGITKIVFGTSLDCTNTQDNITNRANYNAYFDISGNRAGIMDGYVAIHLDPNIGVEGSCPNASPWGDYFSDGIHCTPLGYSVLAGLFAPVVEDVMG